MEKQRTDGQKLGVFPLQSESSRDGDASITERGSPNHRVLGAFDPVAAEVL